MSFIRRFFSCLMGGGLSGGLWAGDTVDAELSALGSRVQGFRVISLVTERGHLAISADQSLTVEGLRWVRLQDDPPVLGELAQPYDPRMSDGYAQGEAPYVARGIAPFRFRFFNCAFHVGGWHNFNLSDYASTHGFHILYPYIRKLVEGAHLPTGTVWMNQHGFDWGKWSLKNSLPEGRYDLLAEMDLAQIHLDDGTFQHVKSPRTLRETGQRLMIDMEHAVLPPPKLRDQEWYPKNASEAERRSFEEKYYRGYAKTYTSAVQAARREGWTPIGLYGWQPYGRTWGGLEHPEIDPGMDHAWNTYGKTIYQEVDLVHNSVYNFYWSPQNVAYVLMGIDENLRFINSMPEKKPLLPYFWTRLHGGGPGWRWWRGLPLANEEQRAMIAMAFFTGIDGFSNWNTSQQSNHHVAQAPFGEKRDPFSSGVDLMLKDQFELRPEDAPPEAQPELFVRYDVVHLTATDPENGRVWFQKIRKELNDYGIGEEYPTFSMLATELTPHLRIVSEPVAAMIEGMALVKPFEYILRHGKVRIDVPAQQQFMETLPIVRRVQLDNIHLLITYDPQVVYGGEPRPVVLRDFAGHQGFTLTLPADSQTRIFVLRE